VSHLPVGQELHGIEERRLLLDLIEDDEPFAVVEAPHGVGSEPEPFVRVIERDIDRPGAATGRQEIPDEGGLPALPRAREDGDGPPGQPLLEEGKDGSGVKLHSQLFPEHCKLSIKFCRYDSCWSSREEA
jgi:hypothetical protein